MAKVELIEVDVLPICPHCSKELDVIACIVKGFFAISKIYICPHYRRILSIGYSFVS